MDAWSSGSPLADRSPTMLTSWVSRQCAHSCGAARRGSARSPKIDKTPPGGGWKAHGRGPGPGSARGLGYALGYDYVHTAVDDHSWLAYAEGLADEKGTTCAGFLLRAAVWFAEHGTARVTRVLTDNAARTAALAPWLEYYNTGRRHSALRGQPPISRLSPT
jgi:hypothetical protein